MTTPAAIPSPAQIPGAGRSFFEEAQRRQASAAIAELGDAPDQADPADSAEIPAPAAQPRPIPQPPSAWTPPAASQTTGRPPIHPLSRTQYIRKTCLVLAIQYFTGLAESDEQDVFEAAQAWAAWIEAGR